jgi:hypothetical protein
VRSKSGDKGGTSLMDMETHGPFRLSAVEDQSTPPSNEALTHDLLRCAIEAMRRKLVWIESQSFQGWACTECAWVFNPLGPLVGKSIDEMKMHFEQQRDKEFTSHVCAGHPRPKTNPC